MKHILALSILLAASTVSARDYHASELIDKIQYGKFICDRDDFLVEKMDRHHPERNTPIVSHHRKYAIEVSREQLGVMRGARFEYGLLPTAGEPNMYGSQGEGSAVIASTRKSDGTPVFMEITVDGEFYIYDNCGEK